MIKRRMSRLGFLLALTAVALSAVASAAAAAPALRVTSNVPDFVTAGEPIYLVVSARNVGDQPLEGNVVVRYTFPDGVVPAEPSGGCQTVGQEVECVIDATGMLPGSELRWETRTYVEPGASGTLSGQIELTGGGTGDDVVIPLSFVVGPSGPFAVKGFDVAMSDALAAPAQRSGSAPSALETDVSFPSAAATNDDVLQGAVNAPPESMKDVTVHVPPGFVGNPLATPARCTAAQLITPLDPAHNTAVPSCPPASQVGTVLINGKDLVGLYNMVPAKGTPAQFGFYYLVLGVQLKARLRPSDYGVDVVSRNTSSSAPITKFAVTMWGVPGDDSNDPFRGECLGGEAAECPLETERVPFLRTPTACSGNPLPWEIEVNTYQHPDVFHTASTTTPAIEGCQFNPFAPRFGAGPTGRGSGSPSGFDVSLKLPQDNPPDGQAEADMRSAAVTLPQGIAINPASADGLAGCSDDQLRLGLEGPSQCPDASKLGTIELETPLLDHPIDGSVFLRSQGPGDPESGNLYRLALELRSDDDGIAIKLPGSLKVNVKTGQLTTEFDDLPQLPFESMHLRLKDGARAPLTMPSDCGKFNTHAVFTSWSGRTVPLDSSFAIDENCEKPAFKPGFEAGVTNSTAGDFAPFILRVTRGAGQPNLSRLDVTLPEGELAKLAGVPVCPEAQASSGGCAAASRIGRVTAGIGEGLSPLFLPQAGKAPTSVYLAGPYKGAPYSILASVPAQAGPFDLGTVSVRSALRIDPVSTRATIASDPLPQIFGGIPITYRDVRVTADRPNFTISPTSCEPQAVDANLGAANGDSAKVSARFQTSDCASLGFKPKLGLSLKGQTGRRGHPALTAVLRMPTKGAGANIALASVSLPHSEFLAQSHIKTICTRVQYAAGGGGGARCPKGSVYGHATAWSPLLDRPLSGPVYLRSSSNPLPDLVASLGGQIQVDLDGRIDTDKKTGGLRTTFDQVPDAPVSKFVLKMPGGKKSLLENSTNICHGKHRAVARMVGQNGRTHDFRPLVQARCGKN